MLQVNVFKENGFTPATIEEEQMPSDYNDLIVCYKHKKDTLLPYSWLDFLKTDPDVDAIIDRRTEKEIFVNFF